MISVTRCHASHVTETDAPSFHKSCHRFLVYSCHLFFCAFPCVSLSHSHLVCQPQNPLQPTLRGPLHILLLRDQFRLLLSILPSVALTSGTTEVATPTACAAEYYDLLNTRDPVVQPMLVLSDYGAQIWGGDAKKVVATKWSLSSFVSLLSGRDLLMCPGESSASS